jgi:hypothetical protein
MSVVVTFGLAGYNQNAQTYVKALAMEAPHRRFFRTCKGHFWLGTEFAAVGDQAFFLQDARVSFSLRQSRMAGPEL